jgi:HK97 family phage prohead protease
MSEPPILIRAYPAVIQRMSGRTLTGRLVPYNVPTPVVDVLPDSDPEFYREGFRPGAFASQLNSTGKGVIRKIGLIHRHEGGLGYLGPFVALREAPDGLYGDVNVMPTKADDVAALLGDGIDELSIEFHLIGKGGNTEVDAAGVRWRTKAYLHQVALEPKGAYSQAQVLAYRAEADEEQKEQAEQAEAEKARLAEEEKQRAEADEELKRAEASAEAAAERKRRWDELTSRVDPELERQQRLVRDYGITQPGGYRTL